MAHAPHNHLARLAIEMPKAPLTPAAENRRAILYMCWAMVLFVANDALVKSVSATLPLGQMVFLRGLMASALVLLLVLHLGLAKRWQEMLQPKVMLRTAIEGAGSMMYLSALTQLPLANATAINLASPLVITLLCVFMLKQRLSVARWAAVAFGFVGVLLVIQPKPSGFNAFAWLCLLGTFFHAARDLVTRNIPSYVPSMLITLASAMVVTLLAGLWSTIEGWRAVGLVQWASLAAAAAFLVGGYYYIVNAMRAGDMTLVAPFRYIGLLFALLLGYLIWGEVPNLLAWSGIALLVGSGLHLILQERSRTGSELVAMPVATRNDSL